VQQSAALEAMRGNIRVERLQYREAAQYRVAVMSRLIHRILAIGGMRPDLLRDEFVLRAFRIVVIALTVQRMLALHFLQEHDVGIQLAQPFAQFVQHDAAIEIGEAFVDVVGGDFEGRHGGILPAMSAGGCHVGWVERSGTQHQIQSQHRRGLPIIGPFVLITSDLAIVV
jgi:hypothetical protein